MLARFQPLIALFLLAFGDPAAVVTRESAGPAAGLATILEVAPSQDVRGRIEEARFDVARRFGWLCYTTEIALNLLLHGPVDHWFDQLGRLGADRTGFRGVMVRSVCVVDPLLGSRFSSISGWGRRRGAADVNAQTAAASELLTAIEPLLAVV